MALEFNKNNRSELLIFKQDFSSLDEAINKMNSFDYGVLVKNDGGVLHLDSKNCRDESKDIHFASENKDGFYYYSIEDHLTSYKLLIYKTNKHKMITAAIIGDINLFVEHFVETDKMIKFALSEAIIHGNWNIVEFLTQHCNLQDRPLNDAIRYNKVEILINLINLGYQLPKDWLAYCMYSDSLDIAKELIINQKAHLHYKLEDLKTSWYFREINKNSNTAKFVKANFL